MSDIFTTEVGWLQEELYQSSFYSLNTFLIMIPPGSPDASHIPKTILIGYLASYEIGPSMCVCVSDRGIKIRDSPQTNGTDYCTALWNALPLNNQQEIH